MVSLREDSVQAQNEVCYDEFQLKLSNIAALKWMLYSKERQVTELQTSLQNKLEEVEELNTALYNMTMEVQEKHITCESALALDCCQVKVVIVFVSAYE